MTDQESVRLDPNSLADDAPKRNCGVQWALPVDARLDALVQQARKAGERTNRRELLSAILCAFDDGDKELREILRDYRCKTVADVLAQETGSVNVISIRRHGPGPRRKTG